MAHSGYGLQYCNTDHMTFFQLSSGSSRWSLANFRRAWTCADWSRGTFPTLLDFNPWQCCVFLLLIVTFVTEFPSSLQVIDQIPLILIHVVYLSFLRSFVLQEVGSCTEPKGEEDCQWSCFLFFHFFFQNCSYLHLLAYFRLAHLRLVHMYSLVNNVLSYLFCLGLGGAFAVGQFKGVDRCL